MNTEHIKNAARKHKKWLLVAMAVLSQQPPTQLNPQSFTQIATHLDDVHFKSTVGLTISKFQSIHHALRLPDPVRTAVKDIIDSKTALLMLLAWLRGSQLQLLEGQFGWSHSHISWFVHHLSKHIFKRWCYLLDVTSSKRHVLQPWHLDIYAAAIKHKTSFPVFWGAINGTV